MYTPYTHTYETHTYDTHAMSKPPSLIVRVNA